MWLWRTSLQAVEPQGLLRSVYPSLRKRINGINHLLKCLLSLLTVRNLLLRCECQTLSRPRLSEVTLTWWPVKYFFWLSCGGPQRCPHPGVSALVLPERFRPLSWQRHPAWWHDGFCDIPGVSFPRIPHGGFQEWCWDSCVQFKMMSARHCGRGILQNMKQPCPRRLKHHNRIISVF